VAAAAAAMGSATLFAATTSIVAATREHQWIRIQASLYEARVIIIIIININIQSASGWN